MNFLMFASSPGKTAGISATAMSLLPEVVYENKTKHSHFCSLLTVCCNSQTGRKECLRVTNVRPAHTLLGSSAAFVIPDQVLWVWENYILTPANSTQEESHVAFPNLSPPLIHPSLELFRWASMPTGSLPSSAWKARQSPNLSISFGDSITSLCCTHEAVGLLADSTLDWRWMQALLCWGVIGYATSFPHPYLINTPAALGTL